MRSLRWPFRRDFCIFPKPLGVIAFLKLCLMQLHVHVNTWIALDESHFGCHDFTKSRASMFSIEVFMKWKRIKNKETYQVKSRMKEQFDKNWTLDTLFPMLAWNWRLDSSKILIKIKTMDGEMHTFHLLLDFSFWWIL